MVALNKLQRRQRAELLLWLESNQAAFIKDGVTFYAAAIKATAALGFKITNQNVQTLAYRNSLRWYGSQVKVHNRKAWRCPHCGGRIITKVCLVCKTRRSVKKNHADADQHGNDWAKSQHKKGRYLK